MPTIRPLFTEAQIAARVKELGAQIRADHGDVPITFIGVLKGSFIFLSDLVRAVEGDATVEFLGVASYHGGTHSSGVVQITQDLRSSIEGRHCVVVEDIVDTGLTIDYLLRMLEVRGPRSLKVASLLDKPDNREVDVHVDYAGFTIPNEFVVGYGLDLGELYRNLPFIGVYQP
ncbi:MAG: hypoxanthine phosphoribosyltransferase [Myxococcales bacterium]|nr:hypoxanthine phosphoribosyltransferase [Myxococcales bacterium]